MSIGLKYMNKVCLLGSTGFIGRSIGKRLDELGVDWVGISRKYSDNPRVHVVPLNDSRRLSEIFDQYPIVINALGSLKPKNFQIDFENAMNGFWETMKQMEKALINSSVEKFINISSAGTVYGEADGRPSVENDVLRPKSWYGRAKVIEENFYYNLANNSDFSYTCARVSNPFGNATVTNHGFLDVLLGSINKDGGFKALFDERTTRDFIFAPAMAEMIVSLSLSTKDGTYNIGQGVSVNLKELLEFFKEIVPGARIDSNFFPSSNDVVFSSISIDKYIFDFGETSIERISAVDFIKFMLKGDYRGVKNISRTF